MHGVSVTPESTGSPNDRVAARNRAKAAAAESRAAMAAVPRPRVIDIGFIAAVVQIALMLLSGVLAVANATAIKAFYEQSHRDSKPTDAAKLKKWHPLCIDQHVDKCVSFTKHGVQMQAVTSALLWSGIVLVLWMMIRRGSGMSRWIYVVLGVAGTIIGFPGGALSLTYVTSNMPKAVSVTDGLAGIACLVAIVCLVVRPAGDYFKLTRAASGKPVAGAAGGQRPAGSGLLGGLFGGPRPAPSSDTSSSDAGENPSAGRTTAKVRTASNDAAVAKGADLARERAKASKAKSRRQPEQK
jgi:hypothetical protein